MAKAKSTKNTEKIDVLSKKDTWIDFLNGAAHQEFPDNDLFRKRLALTMFMWSELETSVELDEFFVYIKEPRDKFYKLAKKFEDFKQAFDMVRLNIGLRRRKGALYRKFDRRCVERDEFTYDEQRKLVDDYWNNLKKDVAAADSKPAIVLDNLVTESGEKIYPEKHESEPKQD